MVLLEKSTRPAGIRGHSLVICHSTKTMKATDSLGCRVHVRSVTAHSSRLPAFLSLPRKERSICKHLLNLFSYLLVLFSYHLILCPRFLFNQWIFLESCFTERKRKEISLSAIQSMQTNKAYPPPHTHPQHHINGFTIFRDITCFKASIIDLCH